MLIGRRREAAEARAFPPVHTGRLPVTVKALETLTVQSPASGQETWAAGRQVVANGSRTCARRRVAVRVRRESPRIPGTSQLDARAMTQKVYESSRLVQQAGERTRTEFA